MEVMHPLQDVYCCMVLLHTHRRLNGNQLQNIPSSLMEELPALSSM